MNLSAPLVIAPYLELIMIISLSTVVTNSLGHILLVTCLDPMVSVGVIIQKFFGENEDDCYILFAVEF